MTNQTQYIQTQSLALKLHQFDFNSLTIKFINDYLQKGYPKGLHTVADMLHWWGKERAANPLTVVNYDVSVKLNRIDGQVLQPSIVQFMTLGSYMLEPQLEIYLACGGEAIMLLKSAGTEIDRNQAGDNVIESVTSAEVLARYDAAFERAKATMSSNMVSAHFSLRAAIAKIAATMPDVYVRKGSLLFYATVNGVTAVMKIISTQIEFELKTPAIIVTGDPV